MSFRKFGSAKKPKISDSKFKMLHRQSTRLFTGVSGDGDDYIEDGLRRRQAGLWCEGTFMMLNPKNRNCQVLVVADCDSQLLEHVPGEASACENSIRAH